MPPNAEAVKGRDAILTQLKESRAMMSGVEIGFTQAMVDGALAVSHGSYKIKGPDGSVVDHGKWMSVGKKTDKGWATISDIWNSDRPLPE
jgi:ketosteroid isomerase-like protein